MQFSIAYEIAKSFCKTLRQSGNNILIFSANLLLTFIATHFTYIRYNCPYLLLFRILAKGYEDAYHGYGILRRAGHNEGIADKAEVDSPGFLNGYQIGLVGCAP